MSFLETLKETFENVEELDLEKVSKLALESGAYFTLLKEQMDKGTSKGEAYRTALEIKDYLEGRMKRLAEETGLSMEDLANLAKKVDSDAFNISST